MTEGRRPATRILAGWVDALRYGDLPGEVVELAKGTLLDYLGCALAGSRRPHTTAARDLHRSLGGTPQSTVLGEDALTSMDRAAFLNGMAGSSTPQLDDVCKESLGHPGVGTHPAALAVGEHVGASGRQVLVAIVAGYELSWRVGAAVGLGAFDNGWHPRGGCNVFSSAVAAAKLLGLEGVDTYCAVLGLAGNQAAGLMSACFWHDAWYTLSAHASQNGVSAALLAQAGFGAGCTVLEAPYGGYGAVVSDHTDWDRLLEGLGERFELPFTGQKPHSSSGATHGAIDATLAIARRDGVGADDVESIEVDTYRVAAETLGRRFPSTHVHATMSVPYLVARALLDGQIWLEQFTGDKLSDPKVCALQERVTMRTDPELDALAPKHLPHRVTITTRTGRRLTEEVRAPRGDPDNRMTAGELEAKFRRLAGGVLADDAIDSVVDQVRGLEQAADLTRLTATLRRVVA
jgi:2-methylcitrate dehydratase PrpD